MQTRTRAQAQTVPNFPPSFKDPGIPLALLAVGKGAPPRSNANQLPALSAKPEFFKVVDGKLLKSGLVKATSLNTMAYRNALAEELSALKVDIKTLKICLRALASENKAHNNNVAPHSLRLYMGFGDVATHDRSKASALAWRLRENAVALKGKLGDAECEQMLAWIADDWLFFEDAHGPQRDASNVATGLMYPTDLASQPLPVLEAAKLRDELLTAVNNGDVSRSESLFQQLPATASANLGLPAGAPDKFLADIGTSAQSHILKFSAPLRVYIAHCSDLSRWHHWVEKNIENQSDAKALFSPGLRDVCHALRTTHESRLAADRLNIEHKIQAVLSDPQLPQTLAQQPFVAIQTMLDKCTVLKSVQGESATLRAFCDALEAAQALQSTAIETLREELLTEVLDRKRLKPVLMMAFAWQMTSAPNENLNAHTTGAQKIKVHDRLQQLLKVALSPANHYDNGWEAAVLRELIRPLK